MANNRRPIPIIGRLSVHI